MGLRSLFGLNGAQQSPNCEARLDSIETRLRAIEDSPYPDVQTLESRLERLELATTQRQLEVLNLAEKVMKQLRARERKRSEDYQDEDAMDGAGEGAAVARLGPRRAGVPAEESAAAALTRFRRF